MIAGNEKYRQFLKPSRQAKFEHIVTNFILGQEERIKRLKDYMQGVVEEFMQFSLEVGRRLRERIKENNDKPRKIEKITRYPDTKIPENRTKLPHLARRRLKIEFRDLDYSITMVSKQATTPLGSEPFTVETLLIGSSSSTKAWYDPLRLGVTFRLGGVERKISLYEIAWSFGLLTEELASVLNYEPSPHVYNKKSLIKIGAVMELHKGFCVWTATKGVMTEEGDKEDDEEGGDQGARGFADMYRNMSVGDWMAPLDHSCVVPLLLFYSLSFEQS
ncbi:hypothetical protein Tco_0462454 [Tanacetum coccineum]